MIGLGTIGVGEGGGKRPCPLLGSYSTKFENIQANLKVKTFFILIFRQQTYFYHTNLI